MKLRTLLAYRKHDGNRIAWHIGDVRDPDAGPGGVIEVALEYGDYGYLAEPTHPSIRWQRCGHGWTKRRALADLGRHLGEVNR